MVYTSRLYQHQSSHTFDQISDIQRYLLASQLFLDLARPNNCRILGNLHKRPEALARYYVTSYQQAEWVKNLRWKTTELPFPHPCSLQLVEHAKNNKYSSTNTINSILRGMLENTMKSIRIIGLLCFARYSTLNFDILSTYFLTSLMTA